MSLSAREAAFLTCIAVAIAEDTEDEEDNIFRNCSPSEERLLRDYMEFANISERTLSQMTASNIEDGILEMHRHTLEQQRKKAEERARALSVSREKQLKKQLKKLSIDIKAGHERIESFFDKMYQDGLSFIEEMPCSEDEKEQYRKELKALHC